MSDIAKIMSEMGIPRYKDEIQKMQESFIAPYATKSPKEVRKDEGDTIATRGEFQRDRDRIIHSKAFRRLLYKTQVFVNHEGDHFRTRMTHSLEVAQIARGIARQIGANEDLVEAIALGHDLGHTPFGHAVERLLAEKLKNEHGFFHNEQSVRIVDIVEKRNKDLKGLGLSWEVREGILKHNDDRTDGIYSSLNPKKPSTIEGQIVALSDTIAYVCHDLDDGLNAGLIDNKIKYKILDEKKDVHSLWERFDTKYDSSVRVIINKLVVDVVTTSLEVLRTNNIDTPEGVTNFKEKDKTIKGNRIIRLGTYKDAFEALRKFVKEHIYKSSMTSIMDVKACDFVGQIYDTYWKNPEQLPTDTYSDFLNATKGTSKPSADSLYDGYVSTPARVLCDYIALMTDRYALETYEKLFNPHTKI